MRLALASLSTALAVLAAACGGDDSPESCLPHCPGQRGYDAIAYHLSARFDWVAEQLVASEEIEVSRGFPVIELDADVEVTRVHVDGKPVPYVNDRAAGTLRVDVTSITPDTGDVVFTVDYTAGLSDALVIGGPRDDDPVRARVVYTDSEPDRGLRWLVAKHDPSDRARWSVDVTVPADHDAVANGERLGDVPVGGERLISYVLDHPIPTYLMAFATGELEHVERLGGRVPLALWFRRDLPIDPEDNLNAVADAMATFERLVGPYPWDRYAVVLLPGFGGGMENATITFNDEGSGLGNVGYSLNAHELAHHWFGDWVTMRGYDDVWTKEGMATFLAAEATRGVRDLEETGRGFGNDFRFNPGARIVDPALTGLSKYTSGPYQRAAWLITQVRALVGEEAFWAGLRRVLADHALADVDGAGFLAAFPLTEADRARVTAALAVDGTPAVDAQVTTSGGDLTATFTLADPTATLATPVDLVVVDAAGTATTTTLADGVSATVTIPDGGYLVPDPRNRHPFLQAFDLADPFRSTLRARYLPTAPAARTDFLTRSPSHQELAFTRFATLPPPAEAMAFYNQLDSAVAARAYVLAACSQHRALDATAAAALEPFLRYGLQSAPNRRYGNFAACLPAIAEAALGPWLTSTPFTPEDAALLEYLIGFDYGPAASFARIAPLARTAGTVRMRDLAIDRLVQQTAPGTGYSPIAPADLPMWAQFFRERLPLTTTRGRLLTLFQATLNLADAGALPLIAPLLQSIPMSEDEQLYVVCGAHAIASPPEWAAFQTATQPWSALAPAAAAALADPVNCPAFAPRPPAAPALDHQQARALP